MSSGETHENRKKRERAKKREKTIKKERKGKKANNQKKRRREKRVTEKLNPSLTCHFICFLIDLAHISPKISAFSATFSALQATGATFSLPVTAKAEFLPALFRLARDFSSAASVVLSIFSRAITRSISSSREKLPSSAIGTCLGMSRFGLCFLATHTVVSVSSLVSWSERMSLPV